jgi:hypothetical protein
LDENKNFIAVKEMNSLVNTIMPGMKGPFELVLTSNEIKNTESYSPKLVYNLSHPKNQVIDITESELSTDKYNNLMITRVVKNKGAESEEYAAVPEFPIGTFILLAVTLSAYIGITRYSCRVITNLISATNLM